MRLFTCYTRCRKKCDDAIPPIERDVAAQEVMAKLIHEQDRPHKRSEEHDGSKDVEDELRKWTEWSSEREMKRIS